MEGNLQVITFYACSILRLNFFFTPGQKLQVAIVYFFLFFLIFFGVAGYFLIFQSLKKLSKYFVDNLNGSFSTTIFVTIEFGIKNLLLAMFHSLFRSAPLFKLQFGCLAAVEIMCLINYYYFLLKSKIFEIKVKIWIGSFLSFLRIALLLILYVQQNNLEDV